MFGHIDGTTVGEIFEDRKHLRASGIHAPISLGILNKEKWDAVVGTVFYF